MSLLQREPLEPETDAEEYENYVSAIALGKTVAAIFYAIPTLMLFFGAVTIYGEFTNREVSDFAMQGGLIGVEVFVVFLVIRGWLPGSRAKYAQPFSEGQLSLGTNVLSFIAWVLEFNAPLVIVGHVVNGAVVVFMTVLFITKSILSRRLRWKLLLGMIIAVLDLLDLMPF